MVCPRCRFSLEDDSSGKCPKCGLLYSRSTSLVMKTSAVLIAAGSERHMFRSVSDVPPTLRKQLQECTNSVNSATILIADRRGKEEMAKALEVVSEVANTPATDAGLRFFGVSWRNWLGVAIGFASGLLAWMVCAHRF